MLFAPSSCYVLYVFIIITTSIVLLMYGIKALCSLLQVKDWILIFIVTCFVIIDMGIMAIYTGLEVSQGGASRVINQELEKTLAGVSH